jgi:hypothetical protein
MNIVGHYYEKKISPTGTVPQHEANATHKNIKEVL